MRMLEEEQRRKLEEERQQGGTEVSKEDKPERAQLDEDSSTTVLLGPPVTESGEGKNEEEGQEICQADGGINLYSYTSLRAVQGRLSTSNVVKNARHLTSGILRISLFTSAILRASAYLFTSGVKSNNARHAAAHIITTSFNTTTDYDIHFCTLF